MTRLPSSPSAVSIGSTSSMTSVLSDRPRAKKWVFAAVAFTILDIGTSLMVQSLHHQANEKQLQHQAEELVRAFQATWHEYEMFGLWMHESCVEPSRRLDIPMEEDVEGHLGLCSRDEYRRLYEYITSNSDLEFHSVQILAQVHHQERAELERQSRRHYQQQGYTSVDYQGITQIDYGEEYRGELVPRSEEDIYWPSHYVEPVPTNEGSIELDSYSFEHTRRSIDKAVNTWRPVVSGRLLLDKETDSTTSVLLLRHPGVKSEEGSAAPTALAQVVIRIQDLLARTLAGELGHKRLYLYDSTKSSASPEFLGAVRTQVDNRETILTGLPDTPFTDIPPGIHSATRQIDIADRRWTITVVSEKEVGGAILVYIVLGGAIFFFACITLGPF